MVHPSIVVGFVSGTGAGLVETFVRSTAGGCGALVACFVSKESVVWAPRFEVSCVLLIAVAMVFADEPCIASRSDLSASGGSAESLLTGSDADLTVKKSKFNPSIHPKQSSSAKNNAHVIIVMARRVMPRAGASTTRSRFSILISWPHAIASGLGVIGGAPERLFKSAVALLCEEAAVGLSRLLEEASELTVKFCERTGSVGYVEVASSRPSRVSLWMAAIVCRALITGFMLSTTLPSR